MAENLSSQDRAARANQFSFALYQQLVGGAGSAGLFTSPFSILGVLAMAAAGAQGATAAQMQQVLQLDPFDPGAHAGLGSLSTGLESLPGIRLEIASSLWPHTGFAFEAEFLDLLKQHYHALLVSVDYSRSEESARQQINAWAEAQTAGKIKDLLPPGTLTALTRLVLANAIYFKGSWELPFDPQDTRAEPFTPLAGAERPIPLMRQMLFAGYAQNATCQVLALPFEGRHIEMVFVLPIQMGGLPSLEAGLDVPAFTRLLASLQPSEVQVVLPVIHMEAAFDLKQPLQNLGMRAAFERAKADFSRMTGTRDLYISAAFHKACVDVNEQGAEAAAASAVVMTQRSAARKPLVFRADHPFLFLIREVGSGLVLFIGRYTGEI